jgi:peptide/nickel transport system substrate-binding protein
MRDRRVLVGAVVIGLVSAVAVAAQPSGAVTKTTKAAKKKATPTTKAPPSTAAKPVTSAAAAPPEGGKSGGNAIVGLTNETTSGWLPGDAQWGAPGGTVSGAVFDRMMLRTPDGKLVPNLVESWKSSSDYKTWEFTARSGIKFHNGEVLDGAALAANFESVRTGAVTSPLFGNLAGCTGSGQVATCTMKSAWVSFPELFIGQVGAVAAPEQIKKKDRQRPIGTGAFVCKGDCWVPNKSIKFEKNPDYWRKGLPKLDSIEFRPIVDEDQRLAQFQSGQIQFLQTGNFLTGRDLAGLAKENKAKLMINEDGNATNYDIVNLVKKDNPLLDVRLRRAWAHAVDLETLIKLRAPGATQANGPFAKGVLGYLEVSGFPQFDLDKAKALVDAYKKEKGVDKVEVVLGTDNVPDNQQTIAVMKQMVDKAGFSVKLAPPQDTSAYQNTIFTAGGGLDIGTWAWLPYTDPDTFSSFLGSSGCGGPQACPLTLGRNVLNWGRVVDGTVDASFEQIRGNSDPVVRKRAAESVNQIYGDQAYHMWRWRSRLHVAACAKCGGLEDTVAAGGEKVTQGTTAHFLGSPWLSIG